MEKLTSALKEYFEGIKVADVDKAVEESLSTISQVSESYEKLPDEEKIDEVGFRKVVRAGQVVKVAKRLRPKRMSPAQKQALRKARMKAHTSAANRLRHKSMKIHQRKLGEAVINAGISCVVAEEFDLQINEQETVTLKQGYVFSMMDIDESTIALDIYDVDGETVQEGVEVDTDFVSTCFEQNLVESIQVYGETLDEQFVETVMSGAPQEDVDKVLEGVAGVVETEVGEEPKDETVADSVVEGTKLSYDDKAGYVLVKEGTRYVLGNRIRTRAYLLNEGFNVDSSKLELAKKGEVIL